MTTSQEKMKENLNKLNSICEAIKEKRIKRNGIKIFNYKKEICPK